MKPKPPNAPGNEALSLPDPRLTTLLPTDPQPIDPQPRDHPPTDQDPADHHPTDQHPADPDTSERDLPEVLAAACGRFGLNDEEIQAVQAEVLDAVETRLATDERARKTEREAIFDELREAWGAEAQAALEAASFAAQSFGLDDDDVEDLLDAGDSRRIIPALARLGLALRALDDAGAAAGTDAELYGQAARLTPEAAQAELARLTADKEHREAFLNRAHPNHQAVLAQRARLLAASGGAGSERGGAVHG